MSHCAGLHKSENKKITKSNKVKCSKSEEKDSDDSDFVAGSFVSYRNLNVHCGGTSNIKKKKIPKRSKLNTLNSKHTDSDSDFVPNSSLSHRK